MKTIKFQIDSGVLNYSKEEYARMRVLKSENLGILAKMKWFEEKVRSLIDGSDRILLEDELIVKNNIHLASINVYAEPIQDNDCD